MSVYVGNTDQAPYNRYRLAIYADNNGKPGSFIASTAIGTLTPNAWNTLAISAPIAANTPY